MINNDPDSEGTATVDEATAAERLSALKRDFIGLDATAPTLDGHVRVRRYLDSAASTLPSRSGERVRREFLQHYGNTHSSVHNAARSSSRAYQWARERVLAFVGADPQRYSCLFLGSGATAAIHRAQHYLAHQRGQYTKVLVSLMEHHSNDLPHRAAKQVIHVPLVGKGRAMGAVDVDALRRLLQQGDVCYVSIISTSNVTGIRNPLATLNAIAREYEVPLLIDASQSVAHGPTDLSALGEPAACVFSGHKVYAPGAPGVLVIRNDLLASVPSPEVGGGMVDRVSKQHFTVQSELAERHEAGTPNIIGAVLLASVLALLQRVGMARIAADEAWLTEALLTRLQALEAVQIYGNPDPQQRSGVVAFNLRGLDHGLVAAILNDYHNIAVRNECFCAQVYAHELIKEELWQLDLPDDPEHAQAYANAKRGMVRVSLGLYSQLEDIEHFIAALQDIEARSADYRQHYTVDSEGRYRHRQATTKALFDPEAVLHQQLQNLCPTER